MPFEVGRQLVGRAVAPGAVFLERLHHDPVEVAAKLAHQRRRLGAPAPGHVGRDLAGRGDAGARAHRILLTDDPPDLVEADSAQHLRLEGQSAGEQLVEDHAERVDVGAGVDVDAGHLRLFGRHVLEGADELTQLRVQGPLRQVLVRRLGHTEVDDLGDRPVLLDGDEDVGGFEVAVDHGLVVGVFDAVADVDEELQPVLGREPVLVAVGRDGVALDVLHDEVGPTLRSLAGIEHLRDAGVIHERECLSFDLETGDDLFGVHSRSDQLEGDLAAGLLLLGQPDLAHAALTDLLQEPIGSDLQGFVMASGGGTSRLRGLRLLFGEGEWCRFLVHAGRPPESDVFWGRAMGVPCCARRG